MRFLQNKKMQVGKKIDQVNSNLNNDKALESDKDQTERKSQVNQYKEGQQQRREKRWGLFTQYAQLYREIERLNLESNMLQTQMGEKEYDFYSQFYLTSVQRKYGQIYNKWEEMMTQLRTQLLIAQANEIRAINNIMMVYLKRVGESLRIQRLEQDQRWVLEQLILDPFRVSQQTVQRISAIQGSIQSQKLKLSQLLNKKKQPSHRTMGQNPKQIIQVLNSTLIHLSSQYHNFQTKINKAETTLQEGFEMLQHYWNRLQTIGSKKCLEIKTQKQKQIQRDIASYQTKNSSSFNPFDGKYNHHDQYHSRSILSQSKKSHPDYYTAPYNRFSQKRGLPSYLQNQRQEDEEYNEMKKLQRQKERRGVGKMFNRKKGKRGIVRKQNKEVNLITGWCYGVDGEEKQFTKEQMSLINDRWKNYDKGDSENQYHNQLQYRINYSRASPECSSHQSSIEQILQRQYPQEGDIQWFYLYDQYGANDNFSLIHPVSNMVQNRIVFESINQIQVLQELQAITQTLKQAQQKLEKYKQQERKEKLRLTMMKEKQIQYQNSKTLQKNTNNTNQFTNPYFYFPQNLTKPQPPQKDKNQIDKQTQIKTNIRQETNKIQEREQQTVIQKQKKLQIEQQKKQKEIKEQPQVSQSKTQINESIENSSKDMANKRKIIKCPQFPPTLLSLLVEGYFTSIETKYSRLAKQEKSLKVFYFRSLQQVSWQYMRQFIYDVERVFMVIQQPEVLLVKMEKFYTLQRELIKSVVYGYDREMSQASKEQLRGKVKSQLYPSELVTFMFKSIDIRNLTQCEKNRRVSSTGSVNGLSGSVSEGYMVGVKCLLGMLFVLIYEEKIEKDTKYLLGDFLQKGNQLIQEYSSFYFQDTQRNELLQYTNQKLILKKIYQNPQFSKINYLFDPESDQGVIFSRFSELQDAETKEEEIQVFEVKRYKSNQQNGEVGSQEEQEQRKQKDGWNINQETDIIVKQEEKLLIESENTQKENEIKQIEKQIAESQLTSFDTLKRSNSREELINIPGQSLFNIQHIQNVSHQELQQQGENGHYQNVDQDYYEDSDDEYVGLE